MIQSKNAWTRVIKRKKEKNVKAEIKIENKMQKKNMKPNVYILKKNQENNKSEANYLRNKWDITEINIRIRGEYITTNPTNITEMAIEY